MQRLDEAGEEPEPDEMSSSILGQSPTIFSLLQGSLPTTSGTPFSKPDKPYVSSSRAFESSEEKAARENDEEYQPVDQFRLSMPDMDGDTMFCLSMDPDADSDLANAAEEYLTFQ